MSEVAANTTLTRRATRNVPVHYGLTILALAGLVPALRLAGLPVHFAWMGYLKTYWITLIAESIVGGTIMYIAGAPLANSFGRFWRHYSRQKARLLFLVPMVGILLLVLGIAAGLLISLWTVVTLELKDRVEEQGTSFAKTLLDVFWPAAYLFVGLVVVLGYNDVIAALRYSGAADLLLKRWDSLLLAGHSVSGLAHAFIGKFPKAVPWMDLIYFAMFPQIGGSMAILALTEGRERALQFAGTIMTAFYLALVLFWLFPAAGPFASCLDHFSIVPKGPMMYAIQRSVLASLARFRSGQPITVVGYDYYIGMPCMHLVEPLVVLWFLRRWRRLLVTLVLFDALLLPCILLLENHYLVDLVGAVPVALAAIAISGRQPGPSVSKG